MNYRRVYIPGGTYFFTVVTYQRRPILSSPARVEQLRSAFRYTIERMPFTIVASAILPDHMHFIWALPAGQTDFSTRWRLIKSHFTRSMEPLKTPSDAPSRAGKGEKDIWQRRFWEHLLFDEVDLTRHIDYIHYNPVKHGLVRSPIEWKFSSFHQYLDMGMVSPDWGADGTVWEGIPTME